MVEQQPALAGLNGGSTAADLHALPPVGALAHHMAVTAPELHIRALAQEDVTKGGMAAVRRAAQQGVHAVDLAGEQHGVAVEGDKGVLDADKGLEVGGLGDADGRTVEVLTPDETISAQSVRDVLEVRKAMECLAVCLAISRITPQERIALRQAEEAFAAASRGNDLRLIAQKDEVITSHNVLPFVA